MKKPGVLEWFLALIIVALYYTDILPDYQTILYWFTPDKIIGLGLSVVLFFLFIYPGIVIHEMGHALAGAAAGIQITKVQIGHGEKGLRFKFLGTEFVFHANMAGGLTFPGKTPNRYIRHRLFALIAGGALSNTAAVYGGMLAMDSGWSNTLEAHGLFIPHVFTAINLFLLAVCIFPFTSLTRGSPLPSDGSQLARIMSLSEEAVEDFLAAPYTTRGFELLEKDDYPRAEAAFREGLALFPRSMVLMNNLSSALISQAKCEEAQDWVLRAIQAKPYPLVAALLHTNMTAIKVFIGSTEAIEEALEHSEKAYAHFPSLHAAAVVRAMALAEAERWTDAAPILKEQVSPRRPLHKLINSAMGPYLSGALAAS